ncbi:hypothetical protein WJ88_08885 [Burkholderia ubonensis]|nr:hypothetical protein WJ88_08885 [Burkholderia ubonensis]
MIQHAQQDHVERIMQSLETRVRIAFMPCCIAHIASIPISQAYQTALLRQNLLGTYSVINR